MSDTTIDDVFETFSMLDDWSDRYGYLIELGATLPTMPDALKTEQTKVKGCQSQVWIVAEPEGDGLRIVADSDAHIVRGLVALVLLLFAGRSRREIAALDPGPTLARLGLDKHLSPGRNNGLHSMIARIRALAVALD